MKSRFLFILFFPFLLQAQYYLEKGDKYFGKNQFQEAIPFYIKETQNPDPEIKEEALLRLVDCYMFSGKVKDAAIWYKKIYYYSKNDPNVILKYAKLLMADKKIANAKMLFEKYKVAVGKDSLNLGNKNIAFCDSILEWEKRGIEIADVRNLRQINSKSRDYSPTKYKNDILYCSSRYKGEKPKEEFYDFYTFSINQDNIRNSTLIIKPFSQLNTEAHEGPAAFSQDGTKIWFTRPVVGAITNDKQINPLNIFYAEFKNETWTEPTNTFKFFYNTDFYSSCHPALTKDGKTMFFASNMPGGFGGMDIYKVVLNDSAGWSDAINLGSEINTYDDELFPTVGENNKIYFSSKGHPGFGEMDIFEATFDGNNNTYSKVKNLLKPINSTYDDFAYLHLENEDYGFFTSDRNKGKGEDDIYTYSTVKNQEYFIDKTAILIPNKLFFDGISYQSKSKVEDSLQAIPTEEHKYKLKFNDHIPQFVTANKDSIYYNESEIVVARNETEEIFSASCSAKSKPIKLYGWLVSKNSSKVYAKHRVYVLENELPTDTLITNENGWFESEIPAGKKYDYVAFDSLGETKFLARKYNKIQIQVSDYNAVMLPQSNVVISKNNIQTAVLHTDSTGKCEKIFKEGLKLGLTVSKEGYFTKDTSIIVTLNADNLPMRVWVRLKSKEKETLKGQIVFNEKPVEDVIITVTKGNEVIEKVKTDDKGNYELHLHKNEEYEINVSKKGFFNTDTVLVTNNLPKKDSVTPIVTPKIKLNEIKTNQVIKLANIYFEYNSYVITEDSKKQLNGLVDFLKTNSLLVVEIGSHTDNRGSAPFNMILSQKRAESVVNYLKTNNIESQRAVPVGYGETQPILKNAVTEEEHSQNRRIEFKIIKTLDSTQIGDFFRVLAFQSKTQLETNVPLYAKYKNVIVEKDKNGIYKYYVSPIRTYDETKGVVKELNSLGYRNTKIEAFDDGEQVPVEELMF